MAEKNKMPEGYVKKETILWVATIALVVGFLMGMVLTASKSKSGLPVQSAPPGSPPASEQISTGSKGAVGPFSETVKVEKASELNAYTVAELYEKGYSLDNKSVIIRGKVVKVSVGIMGKNWLHIQDGTGDQEKNTYDLVVTTQDEPAVGDVVTLYGTLYKDKDFGSGYKYSVIVEEAIIKKE